jgi:hypothetical protein
MNSSAPTTPLEAETDRLARKRVKARIGWLLHATTYAVVMSGLTLLAYTQGKTWPIYPALGWGFGLLMHGASVFLTGSGSALREQWVERERQRILRERAGRSS